MKYLRFLDRSGVACQGILQANGEIELITGDMLGAHAASGRHCTREDINRYLVPVDVPNIIALGLNYGGHVREFNNELPLAPVLFLKATTSLTAHQCPIVLPREAPSEVDYEAELAIVIGTQAKNISPEQAPAHIFGYTCANDVTARDCQQRIDKQWARAKSFDTFAPLGPVIETELAPDNVRIRSFLNAQCMQDASTADLLVTTAEIVSYCSRNMTLLPGTVILTGTPPGVGFARKPPVFLQPGDSVTVDIDGIGTLQNHVVAE